MSINTNPVLTINQPGQNSNITQNQPFIVSGTVTDTGGAEPIAIASVTVQVDGAPPVLANLLIDTSKRHVNAPVFDFSASVEVTGGADPHVVTVTATNERNEYTQLTRNVFTDTPFAVDAPVIVIDLTSICGDPNQTLCLKPGDQTTSSLVETLQSALLPVATALGSYNLMLAGPNVIAEPASSGFSSIRIGIWIEDFSFPVIAANPNNGSPLPTLPDKAAIAGFAMVPFSVPVPSQITPTFAVSIPLGGLQRLANALLPYVQESSAPQNVEISSIQVTSDSKSIEATVSGVSNNVASVPFTLTIGETLGTQELGSLDSADPSRNVPAVINSFHDSSMTGSIDALLAVVAFPLGAIFDAIASMKLGDQANSLGTSAGSSLKDAINSLPSLVSFSANDLRGSAQKIYPFPRLTLSWFTFGSTAAGILGAGMTKLDSRDETMVSIQLNGPGEISGSAAELQRGVEATWQYSLFNIAPDSNGLTWQISGAASSEGTLTGNPGSFTALLPMPDLPVPGTTYSFTVTLNAVETSAAGKLTGSASAAIEVEVAKVHKGPAQ
jgi:hypothetical protein